MIPLVVAAGLVALAWGIAIATTGLIDREGEGLVAGGALIFIGAALLTNALVEALS